MWEVASSEFTPTGIIDQYDRDQKHLPLEHQYIRHIRMEGDIKVVVTMNTVLANLIHSVMYLVCDFTFKRVRGDLNEWEVAVWSNRLQQRESDYHGPNLKLVTYIS